jgi:hypothetical protein
MTTNDLLAYLRSQGFVLTPLRDNKLEVRPKSKLTDSLRETIKRHKPEILAVLTRPVEQQELWPAHRSVPPPSPASADADSWTQRSNAVLDRWRRKDWGPCQRCGQSAWYEHMGFSLCGSCTPQRNYGRMMQ